jgi:hypothetical protein
MSKKLSMEIILHHNNILMEYKLRLAQLRELRKFPYINWFPNILNAIETSEKEIRTFIYQLEGIIKSRIYYVLDFRKFREEINYFGTVDLNKGYLELNEIVYDKDGKDLNQDRHIIFYIDTGMCEESEFPTRKDFFKYTSEKETGQ